MLIDDDEDDCDLFCDAANEIVDCNCHCVRNSQEALLVLNRTNKLPDCIFLDINMPVLDGFTVLQRLKSNPKLSKIPVVMYSTTPNPQEAERSLQMGAHRFIRKTADYRKLVDCLRQVKSDLFDGRA